jgi:hypothetical protein
MEKNEKIVNLFLEDDFKKKASTCETMEDFCNLFAKNGVEISVEETAEVVGQIAEYAKVLGNDEFSEEDLDNVSGGVVGTIVFLGVTLTKAQAIALGIGSVGAAALGAWNGYNKNRKKK